MRRLFIPGYYCGFSNNKMSLDIAIVLAHLTDRVLVPYRFRLPRRLPADPGVVLEPLQILDLFDIPVPWSDEYLFKTWISAPGALACPWEPVFESVLCFPGTIPTDDGDFQRFRNGRQYVHVLTQRRTRRRTCTSARTRSATIRTSSTSMKSGVVQVVDLMKRLRPKRPYLETADRIAASFGSFNAIHLRRGDFVTNELSRKKISRAASDQRARDRRQSRLAYEPRRSARHLHRRLVSRRDLRADPEVLPPDRLPGSLLSRGRHHPRDDLPAASRRRGRPRPPHAARGEQSSGLRGHAVQHVHRVDPPDCAALPAASPTSSTATTTSSRRSSASIGASSSPSTTARTAGTGFAIPSRPTRIPGSASGRNHSARHHRRSARSRRLPERSSSSPAPPPCTGARFGALEDDGGQRVIGDWTDPGAFVTWEVVLPTAGTYSVEIRYGARRTPRAVVTASASTERRSSRGRCGTPAAGRRCHRGCRSDGCAYLPAAARSPCVRSTRLPMP